MLLPHSPFHEFLLLLLLLLRELSGTQPWDLIPGVISFGSEISFYTCSLDCFPHPRLSFCLHQMFHAQNWGPDFTFPDPASSPGPPCISGTFWSRCQNPSSYAPFFSVSSHTVHQPASWLCLQRIVFPWVSRGAMPCLLPPPLHPPVSLPDSASRKPAQTMALRWPQASHHTLSKMQGPSVTSLPSVIWPLPFWGSPLLPPLRVCTCCYFHSSVPMPGSPSGWRSWLPCHLLQEAFLDLSLRELRAFIPLHSLSA